MKPMQLMLAYVEVNDVLAQWQHLSPTMRERLIIFGAVALVTVWVLVWAVFFRKSRRRPHRHHHSHHHSHRRETDARAPDDHDDPSQPRKRRKWRRLRRPHRPRNPTLAETGGLPPVRTGDPPEIRP